MVVPLPDEEGRTGRVEGGVISALDPARSPSSRGGFGGRAKPGRDRHPGGLGLGGIVPGDQADPGTVLGHRGDRPIASHVRP